MFGETWIVFVVIKDLCDLSLNTISRALLSPGRAKNKIKSCRSRTKVNEAWCGIAALPWTRTRNVVQVKGFDSL